jgi:hypothetical protein
MNGRKAQATNVDELQGVLNKEKAGDYLSGLPAHKRGDPYAL